MSSSLLPRIIHGFRGTAGGCPFSRLSGRSAALVRAGPATRIRPMRFEMYRRKKGDFDTELAWAVMGLVCVLGVVVMRVVPEKYQPTRPCTFHEITGQPCMTCGGTRAARALGRLDFGAAFRFNPLATLWLILAGPHALWVAASRVFKLPRPRVRTECRRDRWILGGVLLGLVAVNWAYLIIAKI